MKKHLIGIQIYFLIVFCFIPNIFSQDWSASKLFNSTGDFYIESMKQDDQGNTYLSGVFSDTLNTESSQIISNGLTDFFLAKIDNSYNILWLNRIGGTGSDYNSLLTIAGGNILMTGAFQNVIKFTPTDSLESGGAYDLFLCEYDPNGNLNWQKIIATGTGGQVPNGIAIDKNDSIIISGFFRNTIDFGVEIINSSRSVFESFFAKFDINGNYAWAKTIPSTNNISRFTSVSAFDDGYYFTGYFRDSLFSDIGSHKSSYAGISDVFLYKTDLSGNGQWFRRGYGDGNESVGIITQDAYGNIYTTGYTESSILEIDSTAATKSLINYISKGADDIFVLKFNKNGNLIWFKGYGGEGDDWARDIIQKNNFLYVTGYFSDTIAFYQDTLKAESTTDRDPYFGTYDLDGNPVKFEHLDGEGIFDDQGYAISVSNDNIATLAGDFQSPTLQVGNTQLTNPDFESVFLADYTPPYSAVFTEVNRPSCNAASDGSLLVTPYFGVPPYTYAWDHAPDAGINDSVATGLPSGSYTVTVTDSRDSVAVASINLTAPAPIEIDRSLTDITCFNGANGAIDVTVSGGTTPYNYAWSTTDGAGVNATGTDQTGLAVGIYTLSITDENGCITDSVFTLQQPDQISFTETVVTNASASASDGAIDLSVNGGTPTYSYLWSNGATTEDITNIPGNNYTVTVTDANGCVQDTSIVVQDEDQLIAYIASKVNVDCNGNSTGGASGYATGYTGNLSYKWMNASAVTVGTGSSISGLAAGNYTLEITDDGTLQTSAVSLKITEPAVLNSTATPTHVKCFGKPTGSVNLTVSGGTLPFSYQWDNGATTEDLTKVSEGTYAVTVTDNNGCTTGTSATINQPTAIAVNTNIDQPIFCYGETGIITASADGGTGTKSFLWNDPGKQNTATATLLPARLYTVTATDENGCTSTTDITLTQPDPIKFDASLTHVCYNGNNGIILLTVSGGTPAFDFVWSTTDGSGISDPFSRNQSGLSAGTYLLETTDGNLCSDTASYTITESPALGLSLVSQTDLLCADATTGSIEVSATGGSGAYEYSIDGTNWVSSPLFDNLSAGTYNIDIRDQNAASCIYSDMSPVDLTAPTPITVSAVNTVSASSETASDGTVNIGAIGGTGALTYSLEGNEQDNGAFSELSPGQYGMEITDENGCSITENFTISFASSVPYLFGGSAIKIFPNPTDGIFNITIENPTEKLYNIEVLDISGKLVFNKNFDVTDGRKETTLVISIPTINKGTYILKVNDTAIPNRLMVE